MALFSSDYSKLPTTLLISLTVLSIDLYSKSLVKCLRIYAPSPTTPKPNISLDTKFGITLPRISVLNGSSGDQGGDPVYYDPVFTGSSLLLFHNESVYVVPGSRNVISFKCEASYPVFWNLAHSKVPPNAYNALRVYSVRKYIDPFDPTTFTYVTVLTMDGPNSQLTGNYSCQSGARHEIQSTIYMFWESLVGSALVLSKQNLTMTVNAEKEDINLPCQVTYPDVRPKLFKQVEDQATKKQQELELRLNESIVYSPMSGFTLKNLPNPLGTYKCSLDQNDYLLIRVLSKNETSLSSSSEENYEFEYDDDNKQVRCCAKNGNKKPPKVYMMLCEHPSTCGLREFLTMTSWYPWNQGRRRGSCSVLSLQRLHNGIVRCIGDNGYNVYKEFIVPVRTDHVPWNLKRNTTTYFRWEEIDPQEMIAVGSPLGQTAQTIYSGQVIQLECHMSRYYFSSGNYWMIRWKNQTMTLLHGDRENGGNDRRMLHPEYLFEDTNKHSNIVVFEAHTDMESVLCFAPVWNSSVWIPRIQYLYVNESMSPLLESGEATAVLHYTWYANETDKVLTCSASGSPSPDFSWEKDNGTISLSSHNYDVFQPNITSEQVEESSTETTNPTSTTTVIPISESSQPTTPFGDEVDDEDNQNGDNNHNRKKNERRNITRKLSHSGLRINRVSYTTSGVFRCIATNFAGKVSTEFHITVLEPKSWTATIFFISSCVLTALLMIGIILLLHRMHKDRQEMSVRSTSSQVNFQSGRQVRECDLNGRTDRSQDAGFIRGGESTRSTTAILSTTTAKYQQYHNEEDSQFNSLPGSNRGTTNNLIDAF